MSLPTWEERVIAKLESIERMTNTVIAQRDALQAELSAERTRRLKAEEVVDKVEKIESVEHEEAVERAMYAVDEYRQQYPREGKDVVSSLSQES